MTLRVPVTPVPAAAVGDSVAVSVPVAPAASCSGVATLPPVMSLLVGCSVKSPVWFVVFLTFTVIGTLELVVREDPGDVLGERRPVGRGALHHVDLPHTWLGIGGDERGISGRVAGR